VVQPGTRLDQGIPIIRGQDYSGGSVDDSDLYLIHPTIAAAYRRSSVKGGDILFSIVGYLGQTAIVPEHLSGANITQTTARIAVKHPHRSRFFLQQFRSEKFSAQVRRYQKGSAQPGLNLADVEKMRVVIPPTGDQSRIAAVLDTVDEAIGKTEAVIAKLRQVRAGVLHDLLTRGLDAHGQLRDPVAHPEQFQDSPLGRIPFEWNVNVFVREVALRHGYQFRDHDFVPRGFPVVKITAVSPLGYLDLSDTTYIAVERAEEFKDVELREGDILMSLTGNIGRCVRVPALQSRIFQNYRVGKFEPLDAERWDKDFLFVLLSSFVVYDQIARRANLTAQANIGKEEFEGIYLPIPHPIEQKAIATALLSYDSAIRAEKDWAWKLQEVKSGLMTDLLTGRVRVPETK